MADDVRISDDFTIGAQPSEARLAELRDAGFRSVVNLRLHADGEPLTPETESDKAAALGLAYLHEPVDSAAMRDEQVDQLREQLEALPKPVYAHCKGGTRAGAVVMIDKAVREGLTGDEMMAQAAALGYRCKQEALVAYMKGYVDAKADG